MFEKWMKVKVFITVMTYPHPSLAYDELVCTAGITEKGEWIRLYPVNFRYRPNEQQYSKYQWIEVELPVYAHNRDVRKESHRPNLDSLRIISPVIDTKDGWSERAKIVEQMNINTIRELEKLYKVDKTSLGIVKPTKVIDVTVEPDKREWKAQWRLVQDSVRLFGGKPKMIKKLPYKFRYKFECSDSTRPHELMIEDWELGVLFFKELERLGDEKSAIDSVRHKYLNDLCSYKRDTYFYVGTRFPYNKWIVLGVYYPPKERQTPLF